MLLLVLSVLCSLFISSLGEDYYALLGISREAGDKEIRIAFKKLAVTLHPDKNKEPDAQEKFLKIAKAYEVLKNEESRKNYDLYGEEKVNTGRPQYHSWDWYTENFGIYDDDPEIVTLNIQDFEESVLNSDSLWFINFYSPMCSHCHHVAPEWRAVAKELKDVIRIGAVNCADEYNLCSTQNIYSYPSLMFYPNREKFHGDRVKDELINFVLERLTVDVLLVEEKSWEMMKKVTKKLPWLIYLDRNQDNNDDERLMLAAMLDGLVITSQLDCIKEEEFCDRLHDSGELILTELPPDRSKVIVIEEVERRQIMNKILEYLPQPTELNMETLSDIRTRLTLGSEEPWLVYFYIGQFQDDAELKKLSGLASNLKFGKFNCGRYVDTCRSLFILSYPVVKLFKKNGGYETYHGRMNSHDLSNFATEASKCTNVRSLTSDDFPAILTKSDKAAWLIDFYAPWCPGCMKFLPEFRKASRDIDVVKFGTIDCTIHTKLCQIYNIRQYPTTILYNNSQVVQYHGEHKAAYVIEFIQELLSPSVVPLNEEAFFKLVGEKSVEELWLVDFFMPWCQPCQVLGPEWRKLARKVKDVPNVFVAQVNCEEERDLCQRQAIRSYPTIRLYPFGGEGLSTVAIYSGYHRDASSLHSWLLSFLPSAVVELTPDNFQSKVLDSKMPWLVDLYAPWCGHCVQFEPEFRTLASQLEGRVYCGKMDCQRHQWFCNNFHLRQFPTLVYYRGVDENPGQRHQYKGEEIYSYTAEELLPLMENYLEQRGEEEYMHHDEL